ncbi:MAG: hypothetical protein HY904_16500 [Deltaproteobacteria bacterium]|nr:hypothetical protein [Deltaproteobacteria bacterium]
MPNGTHLTIDEMERVIDDLLARRSPALARLSAGGIYRALLEKKQAELKALPPALRGLPRAEQLRLLDVDHDRCIRAINYLREALEAWPYATPAMRAASATLVTHFITGPGMTQKPYGVQSRVAAEAEPKLTTHGPALAAVPTPDGANLKVWVEKYVAAGKALGSSHSGRADDLAGRGDGAAAAPLRGALIGIFVDLRTAIARELEVNAALPRSLEDDVLGYLDELERLALARAAGPTAAPPAGPGPV